MASTYTLISSNTLSSSAASVTFSSIPSTYTDLVLRYSARDTGSGDMRYLGLRINAASTNYSETDLYNDGGTAGSYQRTTYGYFIYGYTNIPAAGATASTFGNGEFYLPNYTGSNNKIGSLFNVSENNKATATTYSIVAGAGLWSNTSAITSLTAYAGISFDVGSTFYLYGIKNS